MKYDISAAELLKIFAEDYEPKGAKETIKRFEEEKKITLPNCLKEFLEAALWHPFLETADIWVWKKDIEYCFWHDIIQEILEDKAEDFKEGLQAAKAEATDRIVGATKEAADKVKEAAEKTEVKVEEFFDDDADDNDGSMDAM